jgi:hypothetical protein
MAEVYGDSSVAIVYCIRSVVEARFHAKIGVRVRP